MRIIIEYIAAALIVVIVLMAALWVFGIVVDNVLSPLLDRLIWGGYEGLMAALEAEGL